MERRLWLAVLRAQRDLGVPVPDGVVEAYERVLDQVDLASIAERERVTRHDVKARIEEFSALAGHEHVHKGMTSRDLTENVEQLQVRASLELIRDRVVATLARLAWLAARALRAGHDRPFAQRGGAGHHAGQALRVGGGGAADRVRAAGGADRPLPAAGDQGTGRHGRRPARPLRRRRRQGGRVGAAGRRAPGLLPACWTASGRSTRVRSTSTCWPRWPRPPPRRRRWPPRSG